MGKSLSISGFFSVHSVVCIDQLLSSARLAEILRHQAALLEHIVMDQRYYSDYFRVAFYGNFPVALRNKQFIVSVKFFCVKMCTQPHPVPWI